ncbi:MAG: VTT domain-containing protein [Candidatus Gracilibacteria bacterium]|nr:VTT domain-containing protein [Candidatus Gracilibacteria bacterium]
MNKKIIKKVIQKIFHILNIILIGLTIIIAIVSIFDKELIINLIKKLEILIQSLGNWNYFIAFTSSLIEAFPVLGVVVPGQNILLIVGSFFAKISTQNLIYIYIIASIGAIIGNYIGYALGKIYGDSFFSKYGIWFGIGLTEVKYLKKGINKWGPLGITLGKFHPLTRAFLPFIAGSMGMKNLTFMIYNVIGSIIRSITIITLGVVFGKYYEIIINHIGKFMLLLFIAVGIYIYKFKKDEFMQYMREKNEEVETMSKK